MKYIRALDLELVLDGSWMMVVVGWCGSCIVFGGVGRASRSLMDGLLLLCGMMMPFWVRGGIDMNGVCVLMLV